MKYQPDLTGQTIGRFFVVESAGKNSSGCFTYRCRDIHGNISIKSGTALRKLAEGIENGKKFSDFGSYPQFKNLPNAPDSHLCAYFAGHFDGEGHIGFYRSGQKTPHVLIKIANIFKPTLLEYASCFGGAVRMGNHHGRMVWQWELLGTHLILRFIDSILPFSHEKKLQLELAKEFLEIRLKHPINGVSEEFRKEAPKFEARMKQLRNFQYAEAN